MKIEIDVPDRFFETAGKTLRGLEIDPRTALGPVMADILLDQLEEEYEAWFYSHVYPDRATAERGAIEFMRRESRIDFPMTEVDAAFLEDGVVTRAVFKLPPEPVTHYPHEIQE